MKLERIVSREGEYLIRGFEEAEIEELREFMEHIHDQRYHKLWPLKPRIEAILKNKVDRQAERIDREERQRSRKSFRLDLLAIAISVVALVTSLRGCG